MRPLPQLLPVLLVALAAGPSGARAQAPAPQSPAAPAEKPAPTRTYPKGKLIEDVVAVSDPAQKYILYIPTGYDPARPAAVL